MVDGVKLDRIITTLVLLAADRMANTPVNVDAGWENLTMELNLAASLRSAQQIGGTLVAAKGVFPRCVANLRGSLDKTFPRECSAKPLSQEKLNVANEGVGIKRIIDTIETLDVQGVGPQVLSLFKCWLFC